MQPSDVSMAWGVEDLTLSARFSKGINAGLDQFGGEDDPAPLLQAVADGSLSEERIDESARRVLEQKFALGLFEHPYVDEDAAAELVGSVALADEGLSAQRRSLVFLKNPERRALNEQDRIFLHSLSGDAFAAAGLAVVDDLGLATVAVVKLHSPSQLLHAGFFFGARQKEGDLDFKEEDEAYLALERISDQVPTIVVVEMDRPPILTNIEDKAQVLVAAFGVSDQALVAVLTDQSQAAGRLPYTLASSMDGVLGQSPDRPSDDPSPLYRMGHVAD